jgi:hypothetical protein
MFTTESCFKFPMFLKKEENRILVAIFSQVREE